MVLYMFLQENVFQHITNLMSGCCYRWPLNKRRPTTTSCLLWKYYLQIGKLMALHIIKYCFRLKLAFSTIR